MDPMDSTDSTDSTVRRAMKGFSNLARRCGGLRAQHALVVLALLAVGEVACLREALAAPSEAAPIFRAQLRVRTCNSTNAGTNNPVFASLAVGNRTVLDYGRNDFPVNNSFTYDLVLDGISRFEDVTRLRFSKTGGDGMCIRNLDLLINNRLIFVRDFGANGFFLDGTGAEVAVTSTGAQLRASTQWINFTQPFPALTLTRTEMESRVESMAGTAIFGTPAHWGHLKGARFVEATRQNASTLHFDLDAFVDLSQALSSIAGFSLLFDVLDFFNVSPPDPDLDIDFNLSVSCANNSLDFAVSGTVVNVNTIPAINLPAIPFPGIGNVVQFVEDELNDLADEAEALIEDEFSIGDLESGFADALDQISISSQTPICPQITVQANGNIVFGL